VSLDRYDVNVYRAGPNYPAGFIGSLSATPSAQPGAQPHIQDPFGPINYNPVTNYISPPTGDSSGMTSDGGLNLYLILGLLAVAAFAVFMVIR